MKTAIKVGPQDHGRRMSLADFEFAEVKEGHLYELARGVIVVSDVPNLPHAAQVVSIRDQLIVYKVAHPGKIYAVFGGSECKLVIGELESERHPDIAVYMTTPPGADSTTWRTWVPELVVEIVSPGSEDRDYTEKREEYLALGIKEYWLFDAEREEMLVLKRRAGRWTEKVIRPPDVYSPRLLPGLEFDCARVFEAARAVGN
jgi:Uma2 family endonuclease